MENPMKVDDLAEPYFRKPPCGGVHLTGISLLNALFWGTSISGTPHMYPYLMFASFSRESNSMTDVFLLGGWNIFYFPIYIYMGIIIPID